MNNGRTKKCTEYLGLFTLIMGLAFIIYSSVVTNGKNTYTGFSTVTSNLKWSYTIDGKAVEQSALKNADLSRGYTMTADISSLSPGSDTLYLYPYQQFIEVSIDGRPVYSFDNNGAVAFARTPGYGAVFVNLGPDRGKTLTMTVRSPYKNFAAHIPENRIGSRANLFYEMVVMDLFGYINVALLFILGLAMIIMSVMMKGRDANHETLYSGLFLLDFCIWSSMQIPLNEILINNRNAVMYINYVSFFYLAFIFSQVVAAKSSEKNSRLFNIMGILCLTALIITMLLAMIRVCDFEDVLPAIYILVAAGAIYLFIAFIRRLKRFRLAGVKGKLSLTYLLFAVIIIAFMLDMYNYYITQSPDISRHSRAALVFYGIIMAVNSIRGYSVTQRNEFEASFLKRLAYYDEMTGLRNRTAYIFDTDKLDEQICNDRISQSLYAIAFDCNNLKGVNDQYGHSAGDTYIKAAAEAINRAFGSIGTCYRTGGDEFICLSENHSEAEIKNAIAHLNAYIVEKSSEFDFAASVACGYSVYSPETCKQYQDLADIADRNMYKQKSHMKHRQDT